MIILLINTSPSTELNNSGFNKSSYSCWFFILVDSWESYAVCLSPSELKVVGTPLSIVDGG